MINSKVGKFKALLFVSMICILPGCVSKYSEMVEEDPSENSDDICTKCQAPSNYGEDVDKDAIPDLLEFDLAHKFFPDIKLQSFSHDLIQSYVYLGFAIPFTVGELKIGECQQDYECLVLKIGITFFYDAGSVLGLGNHVGDAEMYMAILKRITPWEIAKYDINEWRLIQDFTTAHWKTGIWDSSSVKLYDPPRCNRVTIHSSHRKHGLYHTIRECDAGALWTDHCSQHAPFNMRKYKDQLLQNIGSVDNYIGMDTTIQSPDGIGSYDLWFGGDYDGELYRNYFLWEVDWISTEE